jgi:hypothetical protein
VVQARNGYFALPVLDGQAVYPYEVPLLNALVKAPLPRGLEFRSSLLKYGSKNGERQGALVFDLPLKDVTFAANEDKKTYRAHVSVLALVKDAEGRVVAKLSRDVPVEGPLDKLSGFQSGRLIVNRLLALRPGRYTVESAVSDQVGNKISARRAVAVVTPANGIALSDIVLIRRFDKAPQDPEPDDPFLNGASKIVPTLADSIPGGKGAVLSLYFTIYPEAGGPSPKLVMEFLQNGKPVAQGAPELPAANPHGAIPYVANSPVENLKTGQYEVRLTAMQGDHAVRQSAFVTIE